MAVYSVSYDLGLPSEYASLYQALKAYTHIHVMDSHWLIQAQGDAKTIRDELMQHIDGNDALFVSCVSRDWAGAGTQCGGWLNAPERAF